MPTFLEEVVFMAWDERSSLALPFGEGTWASFMHCSAAVWCFSLLAAAAALGASAAAGLVAPCWKFWSLAVACFNKWGERSERAKRESEAL